MTEHGLKILKELKILPESVYSRNFESFESRFNGDGSIAKIHFDQYMSYRTKSLLRVAKRIEQ